MASDDNWMQLAQVTAAEHSLYLDGLKQKAPLAITDGVKLFNTISAKMSGFSAII